MMEIKEFRDVKQYEIASRTINDFLEDAMSSSTLKEAIDPSVFNELLRAQKELNNAIENYYKAPKDNSLIQEDKIFVFTNGNSVYKEEVYLRVLTTNPDERGFIKVDKIVRGVGTNENWYKFEKNTTKSRDDLLTEIKLYSPKVVGLDEFEKAKKSINLTL